MFYIQETMYFNAKSLYPDQTPRPFGVTHGINGKFTV